MKKLISTVLFLILSIPTLLLACDVCESKQPKVLRGITHGSGPESDFDYAITLFAAVVVTITLYLSVKYLVKPKESMPSHIKNITVEQL